MCLHAQVKIVIVEGYTEQRLPDYSNEVFKHIKVHLPNILWVKENLINIGFKNLPSDWRYGGWIDRDIAFLHDAWATDTVHTLDSCDIMQPWTECIFLNQKFEHSKISGYNLADSFCSLYTKGVVSSENIFTSLGRYIHSGQAWCISRSFYDKLGGLYEKAILGGADYIFLTAKLGLAFNSYGPALQLDLKEYEDKVKTAKVGVIPGLIAHHYHGEIANRQYESRHKVLEKYGFNPREFLTYNEHGVLVYTETGKKIDQTVKDYFISRLEDK